MRKGDAFGVAAGWLHAAAAPTPARQPTPADQGQLPRSRPATAGARVPAADAAAAPVCRHQAGAGAGTGHADCAAMRRLAAWQLGAVRGERARLSLEAAAMRERARGATLESALAAGALCALGPAWP